MEDIPVQMTSINKHLTLYIHSPSDEGTDPKLNNYDYE